jgi:sialic acid synthase
MKAGEIIKEEHIHLLSPGDGIQWIDRDLILGKKITSDINKDELILMDHIEK